MELTKTEEAALVLSLSRPNEDADEWMEGARKSAMCKLKKDVLGCFSEKDDERAQRNKDFSLSCVLDKYYLECSIPGCPGHYVRRQNRNSHIFLGCSEYPQCRSTINVNYKKY